MAIKHVEFCRFICQSGAQLKTQRHGSKGAEKKPERRRRRKSPNDFVSDKWWKWCWNCAKPRKLVSFRQRKVTGELRLGVTFLVSQFPKWVFEPLSTMSFSKKFSWLIRRQLKNFVALQRDIRKMRLRPKTDLKSNPINRRAIPLSRQPKQGFITRRSCGQPGSQRDSGGNRSSSLSSSSTSSWSAWTDAVRSTFAAGQRLVEGPLTSKGCEPINQQGEQPDKKPV